MKLHRLVITCGGTGGHFYPGLSTARAFQEEYGGEVLLLLSGVNSAKQRAVAEAAGIRAVELPQMPSPGHSPVRALHFLRGLLGGCRATKQELEKFRPEALLGMGSFASLPAFLAAKRLHIPCFLHDGNARIGRANRWLSRGAVLLATAFPPVNAAACRCRVITTGMPVRPELVRCAGISREEAFAGLNRQFKTHFDPARPTILIFGGSQGARIFNVTCPEALKALNRADLQVLHLAGPARLDEALAAYEGATFPRLVLPGSEKMELFLGAADLVLSRSGGSTVAELALFGRGAVLIPYPFAAEHHQCDNAEFLAAAGAALRIDNAEFTPERARELFAGFLADSAAWRERGRRAAALARPRAAEELLEEISAGAVSGDCIPG